MGKCPQTRPLVVETTHSTRFSAKPVPASTSLAPSSSIWNRACVTKSAPARTVNCTIPNKSFLARKTRQTTTPVVITPSA
ncbi:hypothetical protein DYB37_006634, partial [Aphanomyces astaci]